MVSLYDVRWCPGSCTSVSGLRDETPLESCTALSAQLRLGSSHEVARGEERGPALEKELSSGDDAEDDDLKRYPSIRTETA
jgi:hypothetical protein